LRIANEAVSEQALRRLVEEALDGPA
jgi:hypothetical protein